VEEQPSQAETLRGTRQTCSQTLGSPNLSMNRNSWGRPTHDVCEAWPEPARRLSSSGTLSRSLLDFRVRAVCCAQLVPKLQGEHSTMANSDGPHA
jgi:hypothetical protein